MRCQVEEPRPVITQYIFIFLYVTSSLKIIPQVNDALLLAEGPRRLVAGEAPVRNHNVQSVYYEQDVSLGVIYPFTAIGHSKAEHFKSRYNGSNVTEHLLLAVPLPLADEQHHLHPSRHRQKRLRRCPSQPGP